VVSITCIRQLTDDVIKSRKAVEAGEAGEAGEQISLITVPWEDF
jgi:hypothetical protein